MMIDVSFHQKKREVLMKIEGIQALFVPDIFREDLFSEDLTTLVSGVNRFSELCSVPG